MAPGEDRSSREAERAEQPLLSSQKKKQGKKGSDAFAIFCTAVVALGPVTFGFSLGYTSPIQDGIIKGLSLSLSQFSFFSSLVNVGAMVGALLSGKVADYAGRKGALIVASIPNIIGWLLIAFSQNVHTLYIGRFLSGFGVGIISFAVPVYIAEIAPGQLRGTLGTINQLAVTIGIMLAYFVGLFLDWRMLAAAGVTPCSLLLLGLPFIPETPRWLAKVGGRDDELTACLQSLRGKDGDISDEMYDIKLFAGKKCAKLMRKFRMNAVEESKRLPASKLSDLGERRLFRPLLIGVGLQVLQQFSGINALMFYSSAILQSAGLTSPTVGAFSLGFIQVIATGVAAGLMDKAGRRLLLMISAGAMAISSFLVGFSFYLKDTLTHPSDMDTFVSMLSLISLLVYIVGFGLGMGAIPWIIMSEIFPANVRGTAGSLATLVNWTGAWGVTLCFNFLLVWNAAGAFWLFAAECAFTVIFVALFVPETRGRTLEEIEAFFNVEKTLKTDDDVRGLELAGHGQPRESLNVARRDSPKVLSHEN